MPVVNTALPCSDDETLLKGRTIVIADCSLVNAKKSVQAGIE